jgi:hypothetical protein
MTQDIFTRWDPWWWYSDVPTTSIESIHDDQEGFRLILNGKDCPLTRVSVARGALVRYRVSEEAWLDENAFSGFKPGHCFYQSQSSRLLADASTMKVLAHGRPATHYLICTEDRIVDLISWMEPRFVILREFASGRYESERPERATDDRMSADSESENPLFTRSERLNAMTPHLTADVMLYPTAAGGRKGAVHPGWGCPCLLSKETSTGGYDGWPLLGDTPLAPGERRRLGFVFLSGEEPAALFRKSGLFYLWERGVIGEAKVL